MEPVKNQHILKYFKYIKVFLILALSSLGWLTFSYGMVSAEQQGSAYGALAVILFQLALVFFVLSITMAIDLYSQLKGKGKIYLKGKRLAYSLSIVGFLSSFPFAIAFNLADSPIIAIYAVIAGFAPIFLYNWLDEKSNQKPLVN